MQEIDTPGHTAIIGAAHPEYVACAEASPWTTFANGADLVSSVYPTNLT